MIQHGADLELENDNGETALFTAVRLHNTAAARQLLAHGANVNHRQINGRTALFEAIGYGPRDIIELLLSHGADVDVVAHCKCNDDRMSIREYGSTPLDAMLLLYEEFVASFAQIMKHSDKVGLLPEHAACVVEYFGIAKILVNRGASFDVVTPYAVASNHDDAWGSSGGYTVSCLNICFAVDIWISNLTVSMKLLRYGARCDFVDLYTIIVDKTYDLDCVGTTFLKLAVLAGCKFDKYFKKLKEETRAPPVYAERVQPLHDNIKALFSQPLTLQELIVMAIRQRIGSRQLWAKIDALPDGIPPSVKDIIIKLQTV